MARIYYNRIVNLKFNPTTGEIWKIDDVPERWREEVRAMLENKED